MLQNSTALIGKGWKIAKEDVEKFAQIYPELMYNATVLKDGSVQLNKEILKEQDPNKIRNINKQIERLQKTSDGIKLTFMNPSSIEEPFSSSSSLVINQLKIVINIDNGKTVKVYRQKGV